MKKLTVTKSPKKSYKATALKQKFEKAGCVCSLNKTTKSTTLIVCYKDDLKA